MAGISPAFLLGAVAERLKAPVLKTGVEESTGGSNPSCIARYIVLWCKVVRNMGAIRQYVDITKEFNMNLNGTVAFRVHADDFRYACEMLHNLGWIFASGASLLSDHIDEIYRRDEERGWEPCIALTADGRVGRYARKPQNPKFVYTYEEFIDACGCIDHRCVAPIDLDDIYM